MMIPIRLTLFLTVLALSCAPARADDVAGMTSALPPCPHIEIAIGDSGHFKVLKVRPELEAINGDWEHLTYSPGGTAGASDYVVRFYDMKKTLVGEEGISFATGTITFIKSEKYPTISGTVAFDPKTPRAAKLESELRTYSK